LPVLLDGGSFDFPAVLVEGEVGVFSYSNPSHVDPDERIGKVESIVVAWNHPAQKKTFQVSYKKSKGVNRKSSFFNRIRFGGLNSGSELHEKQGKEVTSYIKKSTSNC